MDKHTKSKILEKILGDGFKYKSVFMGWEIYAKGNSRRVYNPAKDREELRYEIVSYIRR